MSAPPRGSGCGPAGDGRRARLASVAAVFGPLGWRAIGGPAVHVALMERAVVRRRRWLERDELRRLFAACQLLPGPGSTQLALLLGLRRAGLAGMALSAVLFIGPAVVVMVAAGEGYAHLPDSRQVDHVLLGVDAAVVAIVARAAVDLSSLGARTPLTAAVSAGALAAGLAGVDPVAILAGAGVAGLAAAEVAGARRRRSPGASGGPPAMLAAAGGVGVHGPGGAGLGGVALAFLKIGAFTFGSGYVLLPFLHAGLVGGSFGLTDRQVADAFALSQATPGPVFAVAAFLGVQVAGVAGGLVAAGAIFAPSLLLVPAVSGAVRLVERHACVRAALDAVMAAALGLIVTACVELGRASLVGPAEVAGALVTLAVLWRRPTAQPVGLLVGLAAGLVTAATG